MKDRLISFIKTIHYALPQQIQALYMSVYKLGRKLKYFMLPMDLCTGIEKVSGKQLKIAYMGWDKRICCYWMERILSGKYTVERKERLMVWSVHKYFIENKERYDLVIIELNSYTKKFIKSDTGFLIPRWLEMQLDFDKALKSMKKQGVLKSINRHSLSFEKKSTIKDLKYFYERMYKPYIVKRHKDAAVISDFRYYLNLLRRKGSQLFFVKKNDEYVAGVINEASGNKIRIDSIGILDGREDIMKMGVSGTIYYYLAHNYNEKGIKSVNIGGTSPILTDGLTKFKLRHGARVADFNYLGDNALWFIPLIDNLQVLNILKNNPFICQLKNDLYRVVFVDSMDFKDKNDFFRLIKYSACKNIKQTKIYCFSGVDRITEWLKEGEYEHVDVINYNIDY